MKAVGIIGLSSELDKVIRYCGESGIFQPDDAMSFYENTGNFAPINERNPYQDPLADLTSSVQAAGLTLEFKKIKKFTVSNSGIKKYVRFISSKLDRFTIETTKIKSELDACRRSQEELNHFIGSDLEFSVGRSVRFKISSITDSAALPSSAPICMVRRCASTGTATVLKSSGTT